MEKNVGNAEGGREGLIEKMAHKQRFWQDRREGKIHVLKKCSTQRKQQVQRLWGRFLPSTSKLKQGGHYSRRRVKKWEVMSGK